jgi:acyl-CoA synthetase (AMP-forming)/AMP-acid ligase II
MSAMESTQERTFNLADLFEQAVDEWPDRAYIVDETTRRTYAEVDARANQLAHHLAAQGIGPGDHVGIYALNRVEWVEALWAIFKLRAVWININYRYVEDELAYLFNDAGLKYLVIEPEFSDRARAVAPDLPQLVIGPDYEAALATQSAERDFPPRSGDDIYILFTGGTTGMPKGVVWRHEDVLMALGGGIDMRTGEVVTAPADFVARGRAGMHLVSYPLPPLMHGASQWSVMGQSFVGNTMVLRAKFDPVDVWRTIAAEKANVIMITGDAMARPLLDMYDELGDVDTSSLFAIASSAVLFSQTCKDRFLDILPNIVITDSIGSSEGGANGTIMVSRGATMKGGPTVVAARDSVVLDDELRPVVAGSGVVGRLARTGNIPIGYLNDPVKTAATFVTAADGKRYVLPGDMALLEEDGTITMLGRGSVCINTGGEKVFPEEVENALKAHPDVLDAVVVGVPDDRWGERVTAVVQPRAGVAITLESVQTHCRALVAGYKVPRQLTLVEQMVRSPAGKSDYRWARQQAADDAAARATAGGGPS